MEAIRKCRSRNCGSSLLCALEASGGGGEVACSPEQIRDLRLQIINFFVCLGTLNEGEGGGGSGFATDSIGSASDIGGFNVDR